MPRINNPYISLLKTAWHYAKGKRFRYAIIYSMFFMSNLIASVFPIIWGLFINELQKQGQAVLSVAWMYVGAYLLLEVSFWAFHGTARIMERKLAFDIGKNYLAELYHKTIHLPIKWHQDNHSGATINRVRKAYEALKSFFDSGFQYFGALAEFTFAFIAMLYFSPLFGGVAVFIGFFVVLIIFKFDKPFIEATREVNEKEHVVSSGLFDSLSNIITVVTLRLESRMEKGILKKVMDIFPPFRRKILVNEWKWFTVDLMVAVIYGVVILGYVYENYVPGEVFLIGGLVTLAGYVTRFTHVFHDIAWQYTQIVRYHTDVDTAKNIIEAFDNLEIPDEEAPLPLGWQQIMVSNISYEHHAKVNGKDVVRGLEDVSIKLEKGKKIAFIGESGSGKSTLLALLRGLYPSKDGVKVKIDHQNYNDLNIISDHVTLFPQEPEIFENTIEYNISLGLNYEASEISRICKAVHFENVVAQLPNGLQSSIKEKGVNLSGGQKQRLALARGVFAAKTSDLILLDEPTSSVDPKTEMNIYDALFEEFKDKIVVSALHRLHLLPKFDYVYVLDKGKIVDEGTFEDLFQNSPVFQELWQHLPNNAVNG